jgi:uncharacterized protein YpmS
MKSKWKTGFFVLIGIDLLIVIFVLFMLLTPASDHSVPNQKDPAGEYVPFYVQSNKEDLNKLINYYLKKEAGNSPVDYQVRLGDEVELFGTIPFLSRELNMKLTFEPEAQKDGDIILRQKTISIGSLHLPVSYVLKLIGDSYKLPSGVEIKPNNRLVYIDMQRLKLKSDTKVKVNKFDLQKDEIAFTLLVPVK